MGEMQVEEYIVLVAEDYGEPDDSLRQELAQQGYGNPIVGHLEPGLRSVELQLSTQRISGDEENEKHDESRHHDGGEVDVVTAPWISYLVQFYLDGL